VEREWKKILGFVSLEVLFKILSFSCYSTYVPIFIFTREEENYSHEYIKYYNHWRNDVIPFHNLTIRKEFWSNTHF